MKFTDPAPVYVKLGMKFLVIFFIFFFINVAQNILVPFAFSVLLSVLLLPIVSFLESKQVGKAMSVSIALLLTITLFGGLIYFLSSQVAGFIQDVPSIKQHLHDHLIEIQNWIRNKFNVPFTEQNRYLNEQADQLRASGTGYLRTTFFSISEAILVLFLLPIYTFLLLYYRSHIKNFLFAVFKKEYQEDLSSVIGKSKLMIRSYMVGVLIEMAIVAIANSVGLLILGIKYAIFLGLLSAVLNVIPYIGMITATLFSILVTLTTSDQTSDLIWIIIIFYGIHIIDTNFLVPRIVASRVKINALISVLGILIGGALTGISGLFLSVPAIAFLKIICDQTDELKPWGLLLGADTSQWKKSKNKTLDLFQKKRQ